MNEACQLLKEHTDFKSLSKQTRKQKPTFVAFSMHNGSTLATLLTSESNRTVFARYG
ncbi:MAG: hypothetical protein IPO27_08295 [Bacteroidetes bacterium]|nr:hypothetical protein [Bacteroidota bacterium]